MRVWVRNGGTVVEDKGLAQVAGMSDYVDMQSALRRYLADLRGFDMHPRLDRKVPRTLNADVLQLGAVWSKAISKARMDLFGMKGARARWQEQAAQIVTLTAGAEPTAVYADNVAFWDATNRISVRLQVAAEEPPDVTFVDALERSVKNLPDTLTGAARWVVRSAGDVAGGVSSVAGEVAEGAGNVVARGLGPLFKPILIGAGLIGGGYLLTRAVQSRRRGRA